MSGWRKDECEDGRWSMEDGAGDRRDVYRRTGGGGSGDAGGGAARGGAGLDEPDDRAAGDQRAELRGGVGAADLRGVDEVAAGRRVGERGAFDPAGARVVPL